MSDLSYHISEDIFSRFEGYVRGVVLAYGTANGPSSEPLIARLRAAEAGLRAATRLTEVAEHPRIKSWREAFRAFGAKPSEYRSSIEALARRVLRGDSLPTISAFVDIGTVASLEHVLPAGAHALDDVVEDLWLRPADGAESFVSLDGTTEERPMPGEIIFAEGRRVLTRRWVWRQGVATLIRPDTRAVEFNVDGMPPVDRTEVERTCSEIAEMVAACCGGRIRWELLTVENPTMKLA